jgi:hypothetical protein
MPGGPLGRKADTDEGKKGVVAHIGKRWASFDLPLA